MYLSARGFTAGINGEIKRKVMKKKRMRNRVFFPAFKARKMTPNHIPQNIISKGEESSGKGGSIHVFHGKISFWR